MLDITAISKFPTNIIDGNSYRLDADDTTNSIVSLNPYSGATLWTSGPAAISDIDAAVSAARLAFPAWSALGFEDRSDLLSRFTELAKARADFLTTLIATEAGKPLWESKAEANSLVTKLAASIDAYKARASESDREVKGLRSRTRYRPHGVMAVLGPSNFPASMANSHITPALLAGNTVVFKPSELTPLTGIAVSQLWQEAGLPPGVLNCVTGSRVAGEHLVAHKDVDGVLFVGSHLTGMSILRKLADSPEKIVVVEMGGNSPLVVWDYEDVDAVVHLIIQSAFMSAGQRCSAARRLLVRNGDTRLLSRLAEVLRRLQIGDPCSTPQPYYGPLIRPQAAARVMERIGQLQQSGAEALLSPVSEGPIGTLLRPVLLNVDSCTGDRDEEIFGPTLKIKSFTDLDEAFSLASNTRFGLSAGIVCRSREVFERFYSSVKAGIINWNQQLTGATTLAPFGGVKQSGNFRTAGFMSVDYCSYAVASFEVETPKLPDPLTPGLQF